MESYLSLRKPISESLISPEVTGGLQTLTLNPIQILDGSLLLIGRKFVDGILIVFDLNP